MYASLHCSTKDTYYNAFMWLNDSLTRCTSTFDVATVRAAAVLAFNAENRRLKKPPPDSTPASVLGFAAVVGPRRSSTVSGSHTAGPGRSIVLLLFLQKQNLANAIYLIGLGTLLSGLGLKHMRIRSHHDLAGTLVTPLLLGRPWWSTTSPTCLPLSVLIITNDQH